LLDGFVPSENELEVFRWSGVEWESLGSPASDFDRGGVGDIAFDTRDRPLVALEGTVSGRGSIIVRRHAGGTWRTLGETIATATTDRFVTHPRLDITSCGDPVVAWQQEAGPLSASAIHLVRYTR
jgi:hypothetical protein